MPRRPPRLARGGITVPAESYPHLRGQPELRPGSGSCRVSLPHEPPYVLHHWEDERAQGIDALGTMALAMLEGHPGDWPQVGLMLGDQVYADDLSPAMRELCESRRDGSGAPPDELADFDEYAAAYREAWSEPVLRWLFSTVSKSMRRLQVRVLGAPLADRLP